MISIITEYGIAEIALYLIVANWIIVDYKNRVFIVMHCVG